jgi:hypothetical protein
VTKLVLLMQVLVAAVFTVGCGMSVTPPRDVTDPVEVFVADHGIHTSLLLPRGDAAVAQYSYSRFDWAALDQDQWYRSLFAVMVPGDGTVGTRDFACACTREAILHQFELTNHHPPMQKLHAVVVSRAAADRVLAELDARWAAHQDTMVLNQKRGLRFVRDPVKYSLMHNCNTEVAGWLKSLGCRVDGPAITADVTVRPAQK